MANVTIAFDIKTTITKKNDHGKEIKQNFVVNHYDYGEVDEEDLPDMLQAIDLAFQSGIPY